MLMMDSFLTGSGTNGRQESCRVGSLARVGASCPDRFRNLYNVGSHDMGLAWN